MFMGSHSFFYVTTPRSVFASYLKQKIYISLIYIKLQSSSHKTQENWLFCFSSHKKYVSLHLLLNKKIYWSQKRDKRNFFHFYPGRYHYLHSVISALLLNKSICNIAILLCVPRRDTYMNKTRNICIWPGQVSP